MGMFDSVWITCPLCQNKIEVQSKAEDDPCLRRYTLSGAPLKIKAALHNRKFQCRKCGSTGTIKTQSISTIDWEVKEHNDEDSHQTEY